MTTTNLLVDRFPRQRQSARTPVRFWSPQREQLRGSLGEAIARALSAAFSSREWARTPMPVGDRDDPHSARGILSQLQRRPQILLASAHHGNIAPAAQPILGCVVGGVLDRALVAAYGLASSGARPGDGLLGYIGVVPRAQGMRVTGRASATSTSLASALFSGWLELPVIARCPSVFVRTRRMLEPIIHLAAKNGFERSGCFTLDFHGERQERIVFRRQRLAA